MRYWTHAPESADYPCVRPVLCARTPRYPGKVFRLVEVLDERRFEAFQRPRYHSGWWGCLEEDMADLWGLPLPD